MLTEAGCPGRCPTPAEVATGCVEEATDHDGP
jgi:hypothetical protein